MADQQIEALTAITDIEAADELLINDKSDTADDAGGSPKKITAASAGLLAGIVLPTGRLTLASGDWEGGGSAASTLYYTGPAGGDFAISLFNSANSTWRHFRNAQISIAVPATTNTNYDVWIYDNAGTPTLELQAWTGSNTPAATLASQDGVLSKSGALSRRLIGMIRTGGTSGQVPSMAFCWNLYNRRQFRVTGSQIASHVYGSTTWRPWNNAITHCSTAIARFQYAVQSEANSYESVGAGNDCRIRIASYDSSGTRVSFAGEAGLIDTGSSVRVLACAAVTVPAGHFYLGMDQYASTNVTWNYAQVSSLVLL